MAKTRSKTKPKKSHSNADDAWKEILRLYLPEFFAFSWPVVYADIDWSRSYVALEQELIAIGPTNKFEKRSVDKLFQVFLKNGQEQWVLCHCEIQNNFDISFSKRMLIYFYRIFSRYEQNIASFVVLADANVNWRPNEYRQQIWGSSITRTYEIVKLIDFKDRQTELLASQNPFALVVLAQLAAIKTNCDQPQRLTSKLEFIRFLLKRGWDAEKRRDIYLFLDNLLNLNQDLESEYIAQVKQLAEEEDVNLVSTQERHSFAKGSAALLTTQLKTKFSMLPKAYIEKIQHADPKLLTKWGINFVTATSLEEVFE